MTAASRLRLYSKLQSAAHGVRKAADRALLNAAGATTAQAAVLTVVAAGRNTEPNGPTQKTVADALDLNESAVTAMTAKLIALGYLTREKDPGDRRAWRLALTPQGEAALERIRTPFAGINAAMEDALGTDDLEALAGALERLAQAFRER